MSLFLQAVLLGGNEFIVALFDFIRGWVVLRTEVVLLLHLDGLILLLTER